MWNSVFISNLVGLSECYMSGCITVDDFQSQTRSRAYLPRPSGPRQLKARHCVNVSRKKCEWHAKNRCGDARSELTSRLWNLVNPVRRSRCTFKIKARNWGL